MHVLTRGMALAASAALSLTLLACGSGSQGPDETNASLAAQSAQVNEQPYENIRDGGSLTTALIEITPQFNDFHGDGSAYTRLLSNWYNPVLVTFGPRGEPRFNKDYLADVRQETVGANTRITYTIDPRAVYNDGAPIDWRAFEATWKANNGRNPAYLNSSSDGYDRIGSVTPGVNDRQAVVTFNGVDVWWPGLFNGLLNPKALDPAVFNQGYVDQPHPEWGAGPYTVENFDKQNGTITFVRNPRWWGPKGKLDRRVFLTMESSTSINAFKNGQLDATAAGSQDRLAQVQGMQGIEIRKSSTPATSLFVLNSQSPILADPTVRRAVLEGIDRPQLGKILFQGLGYSEPPPGSLNLFPFQEGYQDNFSKVVTFDPQKAGNDLQAAGWVPGPDGIRTKNGQRLTFQYVNTGDEPTTKAVASATAAMMKNIGVDMTIRQVPSSDFSKITTGKQFDMYFYGFQSSDPFGLAYICQIYCSDSTLNKSGTGSPAFDKEVQSVNRLPTPRQQYAKGAEVETKAFATYGVMPVENGPTIVAVKQGLANYGAGQFYTALPQNVGYQK